MKFVKVSLSRPNIPLISMIVLSDKTASDRDYSKTLVIAKQFICLIPQIFKEDL